MIRMQVCEDDKVRREPAASQVPADLPEIRSRIDDNHLIPVPQDGGIRVARAELDECGPPIRLRQQGSDDEGDPGQDQRNADLSGKPDHGAQSCQQEDDPDRRTYVGGRQPKCQAGDASKRTDRGEQAAGDKRQRTGEQGGQAGKGQEDQRDPEQLDQD